MCCNEDRHVRCGNAGNRGSATISAIHSERISNARARLAREIMATKSSTIVVTLRLPEPIHALLKEAAKRDNRSMANMVHTMIVQHCMANGIGVDASASRGKRKVSA